jgi:hypothetical protein
LAAYEQTQIECEKATIKEIVHDHSAYELGDSYNKPLKAPQISFSEEFDFAQIR